MFLLRDDGTISWFYLEGYFQDYYCGISQTSIDFYKRRSSTYMSFSKCSTPYDNFIIALDLNSPSLLSLTKHPRTEVTKWYAMQTNWKTIWGLYSYYLVNIFSLGKIFVTLIILLLSYHMYWVLALV